MKSLDFSNPRFIKKISENWLLNRKNYIGGSESFALVAEILNRKLKWHSPFTVWCEKNGFHVKKHSPYIEYGRSREGVLFATAGKEIEKSFKLENVETFQDKNTFFLKDKPYIGANLDGLVRFENGELAGLEIKTASTSFGWSEQYVPIQYWNQVQHYMLVTGLESFFVVVEIRGESSLRVYKVLGDTVFQQKLENAITDFWKIHVLGKWPPEPSLEQFEKPYLEMIILSLRAKDFKQLFRDCAKALNVLNERAERSYRLQQDLKRSLDFFADMDAKVQEQFLKKQKLEKEIEEQAKYESYLSSIRISDIEDEVSRELVKEILASSQNRKAKAETIEKIVAQSSIKNILVRAEKVGNFNGNFAFKKLKELEKQGRNLAASELSDSKLMLQMLGEELERIGKANLSQGLRNEVVYEELHFFEKLDFRMRELIKQRRENR